MRDPTGLLDHHWFFLPDSWTPLTRYFMGYRLNLIWCYIGFVSLWNWTCCHEIWCSRSLERVSYKLASWSNLAANCILQYFFLPWRPYDYCWCRMFLPARNRQRSTMALREGKEDSPCSYCPKPNRYRQAEACRIRLGSGTRMLDWSSGLLLLLCSINQRRSQLWSWNIWKSSLHREYFTQSTHLLVLDMN